MVELTRWLASQLLNSAGLVIFDCTGYGSALRCVFYRPLSRRDLRLSFCLRRAVCHGHSPGNGSPPSLRKSTRTPSSSPTFSSFTARTARFYLMRKAPCEYR